MAKPNGKPQMTKYWWQIPNGETPMANGGVGFIATVKSTCDSLHKHFATSANIVSGRLLMCGLLEVLLYFFLAMSTMVRLFSREGKIKSNQMRNARCKIQRGCIFCIGLAFPAILEHWVSRQNVFPTYLLCTYRTCVPCFASGWAKSARLVPLQFSGLGGRQGGTSIQPYQNYRSYASMCTLGLDICARNMQNIHPWSRFHRNWGL